MDDQPKVIATIEPAELRRAVAGAGIFAATGGWRGEPLLRLVLRTGEPVARLQGGDGDGFIDLAVVLTGPAESTGDYLVPVRILRHLAGLRGFGCWRVLLDSGFGRLIFESVGAGWHADIRGDLRLTVPLPADDNAAPVIAAPDDPVALQFTVDGARLREWLAVLLTAVSTEETRYYLNGVYVESGGENRLLGTATDGRRLLHLPLAAAGVAGVELGGGAVWPREVAQAALTLLRAGLAVTVRQWPKVVEISAMGWSLVFCTVDGTFPNYRAVIPAASGGCVTIKAGHATARLSWLSRFASHHTSALTIQPHADSAALRCRLVECGNLIADVVLPAQAQGNWPTDAAFNVHYLSATVAALARHSHARTITLDMADRCSPCVVRAGGALAVLMPVKMPSKS